MKAPRPGISAIIEGKQCFKIPVGIHGDFALVDAEDYDYAITFYWSVKVHLKGHKYASRAWRAPSTKGKLGKMHHVLMHRELMGLPTCLVDHRNHNGLDNRRSNIRLCDYAGNARNNSKSSLKGISFRKGKWIARIGKEGKSLGVFADPVQAALAYDSAALRLFGEFANPNFKSYVM